MTNEMVEARITTMESSINEIKDNLKTLPDTIANKINENVDMKIKLAISATKNTSVLFNIAPLTDVV